MLCHLCVCASPPPPQSSQNMYQTIKSTILPDFYLQLVYCIYGIYMETEVSVTKNVYLWPKWRSLKTLLSDMCKRPKQSFTIVTWRYLLSFQISGWLSFCFKCFWKPPLALFEHHVNRLIELFSNAGKENIPAYFSYLSLIPLT